MIEIENITLKLKSKNNFNQNSSNFDHFHILQLLMNDHRPKKKK